MAAHPQARKPRTARAAAQWTGFVIGVALIGALDEIVFHQLLQWHHFYLHTSEYWRIVSDGLFHAFTTIMWLIGASLLWAWRRRLAEVVRSRLFWASVFLGMGAFQLFDGIVNHKILAIHPVRAGADPVWPYDIAWILSALALLAEGWFLRRHVTRP